MWRQTFVVLVTFAWLMAAQAAEDCAKRPANPTDVVLDAGDYEITFVAESGSRSGQRTSGTLHLRKSSHDDVSPATGERVSEWVIEHRPNAFPLYGWIDADLRAIGAPMCDESPHPKPDSSDPLRPGVLVHSRETGELLTIGSLGNLIRLGDAGLWMDGCGIRLWAFDANSQTYYGDWKATGTLHDGEGYFCAYMKNPPGLSRPDRQ